ncbi:MAG: hypothetical protein LBK01_04525, partial [Burkholderiaceae bacterium]|nr:hypothetical protein [Burkholderiaceae bacterium]
MARKPRPMPEPVDANIDEAVFGRTTQSLNELSLMNAQASENAQAIAKELGYEGSLSVGALEDEIRFYQRRTVEAVLELGKRLLILKELTPHGEFTERVAGLGINQNLARK